MNKNKCTLLIFFLAITTTKMFGYFSFHANFGYQPPLYHTPVPVRHIPVAIHAAAYPEPICSANIYTYDEYPWPTHIISEIDRLLADLAQYTIPYFCNSQPIMYQQTSWYALDDLRHLWLAISDNWYAYSDAYCSHVYGCPHAARASDHAFKAIVNALHQIKNLAQAPHCIYACAYRFDEIICTINQELRTIIYHTDTYSSAHFAPHSLDAIAGSLHRIARQLESLLY
jgi:hypothetical protein